MVESVQETALSNDVGRDPALDDPKPEKQFLPAGFQTTHVALRVRDGITWDEFAEGCKAITRFTNFAHETLPYIVGDLIVAGERLFPERWVQAAEFTDYTLNTLRNYAWMCDRVPPENRGIVGIQATMIAAKFKDVKEQRKFLLRCQKEALSAREGRRLANGEKHYKRKALPEERKRDVVTTRDLMYALFERVFVLEGHTWEYQPTFKDGAKMVWRKAMDLALEELR